MQATPTDLGLRLSENTLFHLPDATRQLESNFTHLVVDELISELLLVCSLFILNGELLHGTRMFKQDKESSTFLSPT